MLSKKSFEGYERNFLKPLMSFMRGDVRDHITRQKKRLRTFAAALQTIAAAERPKNHQLQNF